MEFRRSEECEDYILTLDCHYSGMNGKVVFLIPFASGSDYIFERSRAATQISVQDSATQGNVHGSSG